ncbi:MAG: response regulator transcription factor [Cyclobacteriaceae bacterium]|jgi:DNA-binding response OmpR family regulator|nr:response regulator transcription factor [Cyclobacteriaceae bacterium]
MNARILLIEDDPNLGFVLKDNLVHQGYDVTLCTNGEEGTKAFAERAFDLCLLDVMLPKKDGFTLAQEIRGVNPHVPILFITAKSMLEDKVHGFAAGGDDYLVKPFSMEELYLRMEVFLRRSGAVTSAMDMTFPLGAYVFDCSTFTLRHAQGNKSLTQKEAEVLRMLCDNQHRVVKREEILKKVWGDDDYFMGRSMDVFISKLRKYLKEDPAIQIVNYHGVGFRLEIR